MLISQIRGVGAYLPETVCSNFDLEKKVETTDSWIVERTGISKRHIAAPGETTVSLGVEAARRALAHAQIEANSVDLIVLATATPDYTFPASATFIQEALGITTGFAFDIQAVCSGFVYALTVADSLIKSGQARCALVIGSETFSRILDWDDRSTCVLFGDGAGAVVLMAADLGKEQKKERGILGSLLRSDGRYAKKLYVDGGVSKTQTTGFLRMEGREVFRHAVENISSVMRELLIKHGLKVEDIDWFVPHQANIRILEGIAKKLNIPEERVIKTVGEHANTSAASVPLALDWAVKNGHLKPGQLVLMEAMGGGFTWGAVLARF